MTRGLLACGVVAGPLFTLAYLVEGSTRPDYNPLRHPVSALALGDRGRRQVANFLVSGLLLLAFGLGLRRRLGGPGGSTWGPRLVSGMGIGLIGAGCFATDPLSGYPPGTPDRPKKQSAASVLHQLFSSLVFLGMPAAGLVFARYFARIGQRLWVAYCVASSIGFLAAFVVSSIGFGQVRGFINKAGLAQRISMTTGLLWTTLLAVHLLRQTTRESPGQPTLC